MPNTIEKYKQAIDLSQNNNNQAARAQLDELLANDPEFIPAYFLRAICNAKLGNESGIASDIATLLDKDFEKSDLLHHDILVDGPFQDANKRPINEIFLSQLPNLNMNRYSLERDQVRKVKELYLHAMVCMATTLPEKMLDDVNALDKLLPNNMFIQQVQCQMPDMIVAVRMEKEFAQLEAERAAKLALPEEAMRQLREQQDRIKALEDEVKQLRKAAVKPDVNRLFSESQRAPSPGRK